MRFLLSIIFFVFTSIGFSQTAESVLKAIQNKFDSITDLTVDVNQRTSGKVSLSGKLYFKKDNNLRIESGDQLIITDGTSVWNYNKKDNKVIISDYDEESAGLFSIDYLIYKYPSECDLSLSSEGSKQMLILKSKSKRKNPGEVKLYLNKENLIDKVVVTNSGTGSTEISLSNYKLNQKISDSKFIFSAPAGTNTIDLR